jgi:DNA-binding FrmR family transcriptional regulator
MLASHAASIHQPPDHIHRYPRGYRYAEAMQPEVNEQLVRRLRRAQGQVAGVLTMVEDGRDLTEIVTQLAAVSRALDRAGYMLVVDALKECSRSRAEGRAPLLTEEQVERLFMTLA